MLVAITREVSESLARCQLTWLPRESIDVALAKAQHREYERCLEELGASVFSLPALPEHPDAVFVEDPAIVLDEIAVITTLGCESRRGERDSLALELLPFRQLIWMRLPAALEGGDVMRIGHDLFVGLSARTNLEGVKQLAEDLREFGYRVIQMELRDCLHLKSACCYIGNGCILINRKWVDTGPLSGFRLIDVAPDEPGGANALAIGNTVVLPSAFPATAEILRGTGFTVRRLNLSELLKAESGVTCSSLLFEMAE
jgi:dimethylargininase